MSSRIENLERELADGELDQARERARLERELAEANLELARARERSLGVEDEADRWDEEEEADEEEDDIGSLPPPRPRAKPPGISIARREWWQALVRRTAVRNRRSRPIRGSVPRAPC